MRHVELERIILAEPQYFVASDYRRLPMQGRKQPLLHLSRNFLVNTPAERPREDAFGDFWDSRSRTFR